MAVSSLRMLDLNELKTGPKKKQLNKSNLRSDSMRKAIYISAIAES